MPFEGRHLAKIREMRRLCPVRYRGGDPVVREALDHGEVLHA